MIAGVHTRHSPPLKTYGPKIPRVSSARAVIGPRHGCQPVRFRFTGDADYAAAGYPRVGFIVTNLSRPARARRRILQRARHRRAMDQGRQYGVSRFPVVSGGSILSLRWLDRPAIWGMSESVKYECFPFTDLPQG